MKHVTIEGQPVQTAQDQLTLFFNKNTLVYGMEFLEEGMTKKQATKTLEGAGFDFFLARAFLAKCREQRYLHFKGDSLTWWDNHV